MKDWLSANKIITGLLLGIVTPLVSYALLYAITSLIGSVVDPDSGSMLSRRTERTFALIAICTNIFWIRRYNQRLTQQTLRGVIIITMVYSFAWLAYYYNSIY